MTMLSIFAHDQQPGLRSQYKDLSFSVLSGTTEGTAVQLLTCRRSTKEGLFLNETQVEIEIMLENPEDPDHLKQAWIKIGAGQGFSMQSVMSPQCKFPAGTKIWIHTIGQAVTEGKVRFYGWEG